MTSITLAEQKQNRQHNPFQKNLTSYQINVFVLFFVLLFSNCVLLEINSFHFNVT